MNAAPGSCILICKWLQNFWVALLSIDSIIPIGVSQSSTTLSTTRVFSNGKQSLYRYLQDFGDNSFPSLTRTAPRISLWSLKDETVSRGVTGAGYSVQAARVERCPVKGFPELLFLKCSKMARLLRISLSIFRHVLMFESCS